MMERDKKMVHFGHEHPLIFNESKEIPHSCNACGLRVLSSPHYLCTIQDCNFYIHQACTQLPHQLHHYLHDVIYDPFVTKHSLALLAKPRDDNCRCGYCWKLCKNFTYNCSKCEFVLHPQCGFPLDIQIKHISHPQHPMFALCKEASMLCDVCGREHKGYFFSCHQCNFWIHQDCALLPTFVKVEKHPQHLFLLYSGATLLNRYIRDSKCLICGEIAFKRFGLYFCYEYDVMAHVDCAKSHEMQDSGVVLHLPTTVLDNTFPSLIMRTGVKEMAIQIQGSNSDQESILLKKYHDSSSHSLVLITDGMSTAVHDEESICNACIKPITSSPAPYYYNCSAHESEYCNFLLHKFCADLPLSVKHSLYGSNYPGHLGSPRWDGFFSLFWCFRCGKYNNGFGYAFSLLGDVDIDCALAPRIIKHDSHEQHPLVLTNSPIFRTNITSCCSKIKVYNYTYHCSVCKVSIHIDCARLPETVTHEFDEHPLTLTFTSSSSSINNSTHDHHLCEVCEEEDIDPKYWFYHCSQCDQSFHVKCIPSTGEYSGIKFGGTIKVPNCHSTDHPLTLVRTMSVCSQTCGYCHKIIEGFKDGTALHCADCDFWIHLNCGYRSSGAPEVPNPYDSSLKPFLFSD
ncbi:uncharacterized protein [Henckelia pumila]|uniref:uncharacterized protein n=1 Tax=Henckelia pumila TaxID=405737 RepID=UPI003C6DFAE9